MLAPSYLPTIWCSPADDSTIWIGSTGHGQLTTSPSVWIPSLCDMLNSEGSRPPFTLSVSGVSLVPSSLRLLLYRVRYDTFCVTRRHLPSKKSLSPLHCAILNLGHPYMSMVSCDVRDSLMSHGRRHTSPARVSSKPLGGDVAASLPRKCCEPLIYRL